MLGIIVDMWINGGQRRHRALGFRHVIEADNLYIVRYTQTTSLVPGFNLKKGGRPFWPFSLAMAGNRMSVGVGGDLEAVVFRVCLELLLRLGHGAYQIAVLIHLRHDDIVEHDLHLGHEREILPIGVDLVH